MCSGDGLARTVGTGDSSFVPWSNFTSLPNHASVFSTSIQATSPIISLWVSFRGRMAGAIFDPKSQKESLVMHAIF